jgi:hypothetical protein
LEEMLGQLFEGWKPLEEDIAMIRCCICLFSFWTETCILNFVRYYIRWLRVCFDLISIFMANTYALCFYINFIHTYSCNVYFWLYKILHYVHLLSKTCACRCQGHPNS